MNSHSIGVIGGADGPTAVFITGDFSWIRASLLAAALVLAVVLVIKLLKKKK